MNAYCPEEFFSRQELDTLQLSRLTDSVRRAAISEFYARHFAEAGVTPSDIRSLEDVRRLPFTTKDDLRRAYPTKMLTMPVGDMVRLHASSGTTGSATVIYHTRRDLET